SAPPFPCDDPRGQAKHVHIVVLHALMRRVMISAQPSSDARNLVCRNRNTHPAAADDNPSFDAPLKQGPSDCLRGVGIIGWGAIVHPQIEHLVPLARKMGFDALLQIKTGVVRTKSQSHDVFHLTLERGNNTESLERQKHRRRPEQSSWRSGS